MNETTSLRAKTMPVGAETGDDFLHRQSRLMARS